MNESFERAAMLMRLGRCREAEPELRRALAAAPNDPQLHVLLADCLLELDNPTEATDEAETAVRLAPDWGRPFYTLARTWHVRNHDNRAMTAINEAIRIDPLEPAFHAYRGLLHFNASRWREALEAAETGLRCDAQHVQSNNLRAMALVKLGRRAEAGATIDAALAREPENSWTHANKGWSLLEQRRIDEALKHFRESLRLDPANDYARAGLVEGLKARNPIYGLFLRYLMFMAKLPPKTQIGVIVGGYIGFRIVSSIAADNPTLAPWLLPVIIAYLVFAWFTWLAQPVFNTLLRLHPLGRHALSPDQRNETTWLGLVVVAAAVCFGLSFLGEPWKWIALFVVLLALPLHLVFLCSRGWPRQAMIAGTAGLALAIVGIGFAVATNNQRLYDRLTDLYWLGFLVAVWGGQGLIFARPRR